MAKVMRCGDVVPGCEFVAKGQTEDEVLATAAEHAKRDHGMENIPAEIVQKVKSAIHEE